MSDVFVQALRNKVRFQLPQGELSLEELFDLKPVKSRTERNEGGTPKLIDVLVDYEAQLQTEVESFARVTRRGNSTRTAAQNIVQLKLSIVSAVLDIRDTEADDAASKAAIKAHNEPILAKLAKRQEDKFDTLTEEALKNLIK